MVHSSSISSSRSQKTELALLARQLLAFSLISIIGFGLVNWRLKTAHVDSPALDFARVAAAQTQDAGIILGASHVKVGLDPTRLPEVGVTSYNHALFGASPSYVLDWYVNYYRKLRPPPGFAIVGISSRMFDPTLMKRKKLHDEEFYSTEEFLIDLVEGKHSLMNLLRHRIPLLKYRSDHRRLLGARGARCDSISGYIPLHGVASASAEGAGSLGSPGSPQQGAGRDFEDSPQHSEQLVADFESLLDRLASEGVEVFLVSPPVHAASSGMSSRAEASVRRIAKQRNLTFLDYNNELHSEFNTRIENFFDWEHLNEAGSERFSRIVSDPLREWLKERRLLD